MRRSPRNRSAAGDDGVVLDPQLGDDLSVILVNCDFADYTAGLRNALGSITNLTSVDYTGTLPPGARDATDEGHLRIGRPRARSLRSAVEAVRLVWLVARSEADVVHVQATANPVMDLALSLLCLGRRPLVVTVHDIEPHPGDPGVFPMAFPMIRHLARSADCVIVHADALKPPAVERGVRPERVAVIPHGELGTVVSDESWQPRPSAGSNLMVFGRLHAYKGLSVLVDAMPAVLESVPDARLTICGRGAELDELVGQGLPHYCDVRSGWIEPSDLPSVFDEATIVVLPYIEASQSGVVAMAAGLGRCSIVSDVGGLGEAVGFDEIGTVVPPRDPPALARAVVDLLTDTEKRHELERRAFEVARTGRLSWPVIAAQTVDVYRQTLLGALSPVPSRQD